MYFTIDPPHHCKDSPSIRTDSFWLENHPTFKIKTIYVEGEPRKISYDPKCNQY